jgi:hypothetical protein
VAVGCSSSRVQQQHDVDEKRDVGSGRENTVGDHSIRILNACSDSKFEKAGRGVRFRGRNMADGGRDSPTSPADNRP